MIIRNFIGRKVMGYINLMGIEYHHHEAMLNMNNNEYGDGGKYEDENCDILLR